MIAVDPDPRRYPQQLAAKRRRLDDMLAPFDPPAPEVFDSPPRHYRQRAEFKVWHSGDESHYAVFADGRDQPPRLLRSFPVASERINTAMPQLLSAVEKSDILRCKFFQVEFLSTLRGELLITMVYHKPLDEHWERAARRLQSHLDAIIVGRSRKQKKVLDRDYVNEAFQVGGRRFHYRQLEGCFVQPNGVVCEKMLSWANEALTGSRGALLELYCGNGNFTLPLAGHFKRVLATEISKPLTRTAQHNCQANGVDNVAFARLSAEEVAQAIARVRPFHRLGHVDLDQYDFTTVFVDPPRAGLDPHTEELVAGFKRVLYISCNPRTLVENLRTLATSHRIQRAALFDQFPYTDHMETGVLLERR